MEFLRSQDAYSTAALVQKYLRDAESLWTEVEECSHLAQLCSECILLFRIVLKALRSNNDSRSKEWKMMEISLNRSYGRLKIWSVENGIVDGKLDATLAASRDLQRDTRKYIVGISRTLTESKYIYTIPPHITLEQQLTAPSGLTNFVDISLGEAGNKSISVIRSLTEAVTEGESDNSSDSGFSDSNPDSINDFLEDLKVDTTCLLDLEPLLCSPILRKDLEPAAVLDTTRIRWNPHQPYSDKISVRFPKAPEELVTRLGKANYERYSRCQRQKTRNNLGGTPSDQTASAKPESANSKYHDSGIGSSLPASASAYAETIMSYGTGEGTKVRVPPLSARAKEGLPFSCLACGKWLKIVTDTAWKRHIYGDLEPWICLELDCVFDSETFRSRKDWMSHLSHRHGMDPNWRMIDCPLCRAEIGPGKLPITRHLSDHLEEISLSALPADCEFDEESEQSDCDREDVKSINPRVWLDGLALFHKTHGRQLRSVPALRKKSLSLFDLKLAVEGLGGYDQVSESEAWGQICRELGFRFHEVAETITDLQDAYKEWIRPYDEFLHPAPSFTAPSSSSVPRSTSVLPPQHGPVPAHAPMAGISLPPQGSSRQLPTANRATRPYVPPTVADPIIVTLAKGAQTDPQLLNLTNRVANGSPSMDELSRFQAVIDQITVETKHKGTSQVPSDVTGEPMVIDSNIIQSKEGSENPQSLESSPGISAARTDFASAAWPLKDDRASFNDSGDEVIAGRSAVEATTRDVTPDDVSQSSVTSRESSASIEDDRQPHESLPSAKHTTTHNKQPIDDTVSSYWSAAEIDNFPRLLRRYGTNWEKIADHMATKTTKMVSSLSKIALKSRQKAV